MGLTNIFTFLVPKTSTFHVLFQKASDNLLDASRVFSEFIHSSEDKRMEYMKELDELEHRGDEITHQIFVELSKNFITPFDREDIHYLTTSLDDILDYIHGSAKRCVHYKLTETTPAMHKLAVVIEDQVKEIQVAIKGLETLNRKERIREALIRLNSLENHADDIFDVAIGDLFENEKDVLKIIKLKEILTAMETATDKCEDVANVIESILVKNS
jgi:predicted phosphate transport protein (TIGR00153 family)